MPPVLSKPAPSAPPPKPSGLSKTPHSADPTGGLRYTEPPQSHVGSPSAIQTSMPSDATTPAPSVPPPNPDGPSEAPFPAALTGGLRYTEPPYPHVGPPTAMQNNIPSDLTCLLRVPIHRHHRAPVRRHIPQFHQGGHDILDPPTPMLVFQRPVTSIPIPNRGVTLRAHPSL
jgi:hypothetical protein